MSELFKLPQGVTIPKRWKKSFQKLCRFTEGFQDALEGRPITDEFETGLLQYQGSGILEAYKAGHEAGAKHRQEQSNTQ